MHLYGARLFLWKGLKGVKEHISVCGEETMDFIKIQCMGTCEETMKTTDTTTAKKQPVRPK